MKQLNLTTLFTLPLLAFCSYAHESGVDETPTHLTLKTAMSFQNKATTDEVWMIPGLLMGGESTPRLKGAAIDDTQLTGKLVLEDQVSVHGKIGFHQHAGEGELSLEELWFNKIFQLNHSRLDVEIGLMATDITSTANHHASQSQFNTKPLLAQTFFGGHHKDTGVKSKYYWHKFQFGLEVWNGDSWPYTSSEGSKALYLTYQDTIISIDAQSGLWYSQGSALSRQDLRYSSDHNHSNSTTLNTPENYFTGDIEMLGGFLKFTKSYSNALLLMTEFEIIESRQSGVFSDTSQSAKVKLQQTGYRGLFGLQWQNHSLVAQHEMLVVNNQFKNTTTAFIEQQGLYNKNFEPKQTTITYNWQWQNKVTFRLETSYDQTMINSTQQVWSVGFTWQHNLL
ncbi:hypothetical protein Q4575_03840 [Psychrosphaera sp. 1_MG-2023]|uniref:hypothetical protein n=1 Tax=Psychrosphaera sp. 1_MG-2023 TaxID=3062643 RepID=UPI0026E3D338|nr:hypothetical protein [Psychrosphaera sp. 1_MG-2023]MDO6718516.1 hypothetical protein [Psychrosphaera sp. 1_MG-2023]